MCIWIFSFLSWLKETLLIFLCSHTLIFFISKATLCSLLSSFLLCLSIFHVALFGYLFLCVTSLFGILKHQTKLQKIWKSIFFFSLDFTLYISSPYREDTRAKVIKFFIIYIYIYIVWYQSHSFLAGDSVVVFSVVYLCLPETLILLCCVPLAPP